LRQLSGEAAVELRIILEIALWPFVEHVTSVHGENSREKDVVEFDVIT
jgi:hypothetical protein